MNRVTAYISKYSLDQRIDAHPINDVEISSKKHDFSKLRKQLGRYKAEKCMYCKIPFLGATGDNCICDSHSIPRHSLKKISKNGHLNNLNSILQFKLLTTQPGISRTGVFKLLCRRCDANIFIDYENFNNYTPSFAENQYNQTTQKILNQIAMKNFLWSLYSQLSAQNIAYQMPHISAGYESRLDIYEIDIHDYRNSFERTKRLSKQNILNNEYSIGFYHIYPRTVPVAFQGCITPRQSFDGRIINNVYQKEEKMNHMHLCIFPSDGSTIALAFSKRKDHSLRPLFQYVRGLGKDDALRALIALAIDASENFFISDSLNICDYNTDYIKKLAGDTGSFWTTINADTPITSEFENELKEHAIQHNFHERPLIADYCNIPNILIGL